MTKTRIEWTDEVWNPVTGCSKVSHGCKHCYAERMWGRLSAPGMPYAGRAFTDVQCHPERLDQPLHWKRPRRIFVNSMSDLFHEDVPDEFLDRVFAIMALAPQHTFQILTKRPRRMLNTFMRWALVDGSGIADAAFDMQGSSGKYGERIFPPAGWPTQWPLPNVWLGVSVEDQATADERIPILLKTPAAVRWISAEPLLGPVDLTAIKQTVSPGYFGDVLEWHHQPHCDRDRPYPRMDWVVVGGESGPHARPMHPDWARSLRDQCAAAGVPFLFKQWGEFCNHVSDAKIRLMPTFYMNGGGRLASEDEAIRDGGRWTGMYRLGKKAAGRRLDGELWDQYPS